MNKRLRKKRHLGEFKEYMFDFSLKLRPELTESELDVWLDDLLDVIVASKLSIGGGGGHEQKYCCYRWRRRCKTPITLEDRDALERWLAQDSRVVSCQMGDLEDAWYPVKTG